MRLWLARALALLLTLTAWGSDVLHAMRLAPDDAPVASETTPGEGEPDPSRTDGLEDEVAVAPSTLHVWATLATVQLPLEACVDPERDEHSADLMRPPRGNAA